MGEWWHRLQPVSGNWPFAVLSCGAANPGRRPPFRWPPRSSADIPLAACRHVGPVGKSWQPAGRLLIGLRERSSRETLSSFLPVRALTSSAPIMQPASSAERHIAPRKQQLQFGAGRHSPRNPSEVPSPARAGGHPPARRPRATCWVGGTQTTVPIRLRFRLSPCTTTTNPGPEPMVKGRSAHQIPPWEIATRSSLRHGGPPGK